MEIKISPEVKEALKCKAYSDEEVRGCAKNFLKVVLERPEFAISTLNDLMVDCPVGCNPYWKPNFQAKKGESP